MTRMTRMTRQLSIAVGIAAMAASISLSLTGCGSSAYHGMSSADYAAMKAGPNTEQYTDYGVGAMTDPRQDRLSTFAIDVDTGSYTIARRKLQEGTLPPIASVRVEEFVNFFDYGYAAPDGESPMNVEVAAAPSPFNKDRLYVRVGIQGAHIAEDERPPAHLVFLVDTSGSMDSSDKLGLVQDALELLVENLRAGDTVALATYAGSVREVLPPTDVRDADTIIDAIDDLDAGGSTAMGSGLQLAYKLAYQNFKPGHINRVIVCSDGDANVGATDHGTMVESIRHYVDEGITVSTIGVGMGNYKDTMMEQLANLGNGNYYYFDDMDQAEKAFGEDLLGTLLVIAKDVKVQVEFDPDAVDSYRLIGYENREVADKDFRNDKADGGEMGSGHNVTALYEVKLKAEASELNPATVRVRYLPTVGGKGIESQWPLTRASIAPTFADAPRSLRLAVSVASFAEVLRGSPYVEGVKLGDVLEVAQSAVGESKDERELLELIGTARRLAGEPGSPVSTR